jgi:hypothetical protein
VACGLALLQLNYFTHCTQNFNSHYSPPHFPSHAAQLPHLKKLNCTLIWISMRHSTTIHPSTTVSFISDKRSHETCNNRLPLRHKWVTPEPQLDARGSPYTPPPPPNKAKWTLVKRYVLVISQSGHTDTQTSANVALGFKQEWEDADQLHFRAETKFRDFTSFYIESWRSDRKTNLVTRSSHKAEKMYCLSVRNYITSQKTFCNK